jgi:hypothetical protein
LPGRPDRHVADLDVGGLLDGERDGAGDRLGRDGEARHVVANLRARGRVVDRVGTGKDLAAHSHGPIGDAVSRLLDAGRAAGTIRPDVDARDVIILIGYLSRLEPAEFDGRARRLLGVILDGLRAPG